MVANSIILVVSGLSWCLPSICPFSWSSVMLYKTQDYLWPLFGRWLVGRFRSYLIVVSSNKTSLLIRTQLIHHCIIRCCFLFVVRIVISFTLGRTWNYHLHLFIYFLTFMSLLNRWFRVLNSTLMASSPFATLVIWS